MAKKVFFVCDKCGYQTKEENKYDEGEQVVVGGVYNPNNNEYWLCNECTEELKNYLEGGNKNG